MKAIDPDAPASVRLQRTLFGHPIGLTVLFLTEMWADFSYYGMRVLLVYYMTKKLGYSVAVASTIYGLYTAAAHLTPLAGGVLADRWLGRKLSVAAGATIMAVGHFMMASPSLLFYALVTISVGFGIFLPSLPGQVGSLYVAGDRRRDSAYSVYYLGINLGSFLAPLVCGTLGEKYGWDVGFAAAGVGMFIGLTVYLVGIRWLPPEPSAALRDTVRHTSLWVALRPVLRPLLVVALAVIAFRVAYEQIGNSVALWADTGVDRDLGGYFVIPMTWLQSLNPLFIFILTPILVKWWDVQSTRGKSASLPGKMSFGALLLGSAFLCIAISVITRHPSQLRSSWETFVLFMFVLTAGELFFMPIGIALTTSLAPANQRATLLGVWFVLAFFANLLAGLLGTRFSQWPAALFFTVCAGCAFLSAALLYGLRRATFLTDSERNAKRGYS